MVSECKKMIFRRESLILFLLTTLCLAALLIRVDAPSPKLMKYYREFIAEYRMPASQAVQYINDEIQAIGSVDTDDPESSGYIRYSALSSLAASASVTAERDEKIVKILNELRAQKESAPTEFTRRDLQLAYDSYNKAHTYHVFPPEMIFGVWYCENNIFSYLFLIIITAFLGDLFSMETESGMYQILYSCKRGKKGLFLRKYFAAVFCTAIISLLFTAVTTLGGWAKHGLSFFLLGEPIQCLGEFSMCPFDLTIGSYIMILFFMRFLVGIFVLSVICLVSVFVKKGASVFGFTAAIFLVDTALCSDKFPQIISHGARKFGGCGLLELQKYITAYSTVNVFGRPVMSLYLAIGCTAAVSLFISLLAYNLFSEELKGVKQYA